MTENLSDEDLMVMYQNGSEEAFSILYKRHSPKIYGYVKARIGSEEKARDVYQEIYIKIHRSKHLYNRTFPVLPWFFTITRSVLIDEVRKERSVKQVFQENLKEMVVPAAVRSNVDMSSVLSQLPDAQKIAIEQRYVNEKTFEEIARHLKTSPDNVRQLVSRGLKKLRSTLRPGAEQ